MPTLSGHEIYVYGFHLPLVRDSQRVQDQRHEGLYCREPPAEATAVPSRMVKKIIQPYGM